MLTEDDKQQLVELLFPPVLKPDGSLDSGSFVLGVEWSEEDNMRKYLTPKQRERLEKKGTTVCAVTINMGSLKKAAMGISKDEPIELDDKFLILANIKMNFHQAGTSLCHELGHVVGTTLEDDPSEEFAETWAFYRILNADMPVEERLKFLGHIDSELIDVSKLDPSKLDGLA